MDERILPSSYFQYSPSPHSSPHHSIRPSSAALDRERYLAELIHENQKLGPFTQVLPLCSKLLKQEIIKVSSWANNQNFLSPERIEHDSPMRLTGHPSNGGPMDMEGWTGIQTEGNGNFQKMGFFQGQHAGWNGALGVPSTPLVKRVIRLDVPVDQFPTYNFVGRLLGPRGNSLKRVEASTQCRVYIRGRGSVKDTVKEDKLRDKPGYEHLNEPLHVLVEAEFPADIIDNQLKKAVTILEELFKPVDESHDFFKKQQLRELAMLNGTLREESPHMSPGASPFNSTVPKRAKTGR